MERIDLFELGWLPKSKAEEAKELFLEADGVNICLQREKPKKCELKVGVAYSDKKDGKTLDKVIHLDLADGNMLWQGLTVRVAKVFNLAKLAKTTIGGDEASFVRLGQKLFQKCLLPPCPLSYRQGYKKRFLVGQKPHMRQPEKRWLAISLQLQLF